MTDRRRSRIAVRLAETLVVLTALTAGTVLLAPPAHATFAGENGRIAFRRFLDEDRTTGAVFTIRPDGTGERQVTSPPAGFVDRNPDISPDGRRIAFEREGESYDEIFVVDVNGSHLRQLTASPVGTLCTLGGSCSGTPAWSPDRLPSRLGPDRGRPVRA